MRTLLLLNLGCSLLIIGYWAYKLWHRMFR